MGVWTWVAKVLSRLGDVAGVQGKSGLQTLFNAMKGRDLAQGLSELCMNWEEARVVAPWYDVSEVLIT